LHSAVASCAPDRTRWHSVRSRPWAGYLFVSYTRTDRHYVVTLADHLREQGIDVWFDYEIASGDRWLRVIQEKIDGCAGFVVVMTPESEESEWATWSANPLRRAFSSMTFLKSGLSSRQ
jgi:hypothetical protein